MIEPADKPDPPKNVISYSSAPRVDGDWGEQSHWSGKVTAILLALPIIIYFGFGVVYRIWLLFQ